MEVREQERRAVQRAMAGGVAERVERVRYGVYRVASSSQPGVAYTVTHGPSLGGEAAMHCTCPSGYRPACRHRAAVALRKLGAQGVKVTGVKAPERTARREVALV